MRYRKKPVEVEAVRVTAADYNPAASIPFDGSPFSERPDWLIRAIESQFVRIDDNHKHTDYAEWVEFNRAYEAVEATPPATGE